MFIYLFLLVALQLLRIFAPQSEQVVFIATNVMFSILVLYRMYLLYKGPQSLLNPNFLANIVSFLFAYGITSYYFYNDPSFIFLLQYPYRTLNDAMIYISIAYAGMWLGYDAESIKRIALNTFKVITNNGKWLRRKFNPNWFIIYSLFVISIIVKIIYIKFGIYGFASAPDSLKNASNYIMFLNYFQNANLLVLIIVTFQYYMTGNKYLLLLIVLVSSVFFGFLSGMKSTVSLPFIIVIFIRFIVLRKINFKLVAVAILSVFSAYYFIESYRIATYRDKNFNHLSFKYIVKSVFTARENHAYDVDQRAIQLEEGTLVSIIKRNNYLLVLSKAIEYKDYVGIKDDDPDFLFSIITSPFQAFIPRFIWNTKPRGNLGQWFSVVVHGYRNSNTAISTSPVGYLYLAGGITAIFLGFILVGFFQNLIWFFYKSRNFGSILIFLLLLRSTVDINSSFDGMLIGFFRNIPLFILLQYLIFKPDYSHIKNRSQN